MLITRRTRIGLATLAILAAALVAVHLWLRAESGSVQMDERGPQTLEAFTLRDEMPPPPRRGQPRPEPTPVVPPVDLGNGVVATIESVGSTPAFADAFDFLRRRPTSRRSEQALLNARELRQQVRLTLSVRDPAPPHEQDHPVRIAGVVSQGMGLDNYLIGSRQRSMAMATIDVDRQRVPVELAMPSGPFVEVERMAPGDVEPTRPAGAPADVPWRLFSVEEAKGKLLVVLADTGVTRDKLGGKSWLLHAVCHDGRIVAPDGSYSFSGTSAEVRMNVEMKDVAYVAYRCRPYEWRPIGEVDLPDAEYEVTSAYLGGTVTASSRAEAGRLFREHQEASTQATRPADGSGDHFRIRSKRPAGGSTQVRTAPLPGDSQSPR